MKSQHVKLLNFCKTYDLNSVSYTSSSMPFQPFQKKKKRKMLVNQVVSACNANDHDPSACKYFIAVK